MYTSLKQISVKMAPIKILLIVGVLILPIVENAPSSIVKTPSKKDFQTRIVFVDEDAKDAVVGTSQMLPKSKQIANSPPVARTLEVKAREPSILSQMDDDRRIWGVAVETSENEEDDSYYNRPLALPEFIPKMPTSNQRGAAEPSMVQIVSKADTPVEVKKPGTCDVAILICCQNPSKLKECFKSQGCVTITEDMFQYLCGSDSINRIIQDIGKYYNSNTK